MASSRDRPPGATPPPFAACPVSPQLMLKPLILLGLMVACLGRIAAAEKPPGPNTTAELQAVIEKHLRDVGAPGVAVAIVSGGQIEWVSGIGLADMATQRPVTTKTLFPIGSVTKGFTAIAALKLQEDGKLKLTDTWRQWMPEYPIDNRWESTDPLRLVHLLEHTAGIPDARGSAWAHNDPKPVTTAEAMAFEPGLRFTRWRPGSRFAYTNYGAMLAAAVVEKAAGQTFEEYVRENVFLPLGMNTATYFQTPEIMEDSTTTYDRDGRTVIPYTHYIYRPAGAIKASAEDMANYLLFHVQRGSFDGRQILSAESMARMEVPGTLPSVQVGVTSGHGLFNMAKFTHGFEGRGHDGHRGGGLASMLYLPELGMGRIIMMNSVNSTAFRRIMGSVDGYLFRDIEAPAKTVGTATLTAEMQQKLPGYYRNIGPRDYGYLGFFEHYFTLFKVEADPQGMTWRQAPNGRPVRFVALTDKLFQREDAARPSLAIIRGEEGETWLQSDLATYQKTSEARHWFTLGSVAVSYALAATTMLFALIWGARKAIGRLARPGPLSVRVMPLLTSAALFGFVWFYGQADAAGGVVLGGKNALTIGIMLTSMVVPLGTLGSVAALWRHRRAPMNRFAYWHSVLVTLGLVFMTGFFLIWGMVGLRMWV